MTPQPVHGNINHAMRQNYNEFGVDNYYRKVSTTYRNPFFPGIKRVIFSFLNRWFEMEGKETYDRQVGQTLRILDMAAGSGEVTQCLLEWRESVSGAHRPSISAAHGIDRVPAALPGISSSVVGRPAFIPANARRTTSHLSSKAVIGSHQPDLSSSPPSFLISATDPYTSPAYTDRTSRPCHALSFSDLASGLIPPETETDDAGLVWDIIFCSFALHLVPETEMFPLCYELSTKARWLVVVAPHKKPEIKEGWGWTRWDLAKWDAAGERVYRVEKDDEGAETELEIVQDKVKLRVYRSINA